MNFTPVYRTTLVPELPGIINSNNQVIQRYLDVFYNASTGVIISPVNTTGRVKAATGEFVNVIVDNLTVKSQYTNLYENTTTIDNDYYYTWLGGDTSTRDASISSMIENALFAYINLQTPYIKISNDVSTALKASALGQEVQVLFDISTNTSDYHLLIDPSIGGTYQMLSVAYSDAPTTWLKLIALEYDASWGYTWGVKQYGGTYTII